MALALLAMPAIAAQAEPRPPSRATILAELAQRDRQVSTGLTLGLQIQQRGPTDPHDAGEIQVGALVRSGDEIALVTESRWATAPRYVAPQGDDNSESYDDQGRYLVWRRVREDVLLTSETLTRRSEILLHRVDAGGKVEVDDPPFVSTLVLDAKDSWAHWQLHAILHAFGRGYSDLLGESPQITSREGRVTTLEATGPFAGHSGTWAVEVREDLPQLVQSARFSLPGAREPAVQIEVQTDGQSSRTGFGTAGTLRLGTSSKTDYLFEIALESQRADADSELLDGIRRRLAADRRSAAAKTYDYRRAAVGGGGSGWTDAIPLPEEGPKPPCCLCQDLDPTIPECYNHGDVCYSFACQDKLVDSARCTPFGDSVARDCNRTPSYGPLYTIVEKANFDPEDNCPYPPTSASLFTDRVVFPVSCYQCRPDRHDFYDAVCERRHCFGPLTYTRYEGTGWDCPGTR